MARRFLDAYSGMTEHLHADGADRRFAIEYAQDVEPFLDAARARRADGDGYGKSRDLRHVASIPPVVYLAWLKQYGTDPLRPGNEPLLRRILNDSEWSLLRTSSGRM